MSIFLEKKGHTDLCSEKILTRPRRLVIRLEKHFATTVGYDGVVRLQCAGSKVVQIFGRKSLVSVNMF